MILAEVGEPVLRRTLAVMRRNQEMRGTTDYASLADIWIAAKKTAERVRNWDADYHTARSARGKRHNYR